MRVLIIPPKSNYPDAGPDIKGLPGLGVPYLAAYLRASGHEVSGLCVSYAFCDGGAKKHLEREIVRATSDFQPDAVCISGLSSDYLFVKDAVAIIRRSLPSVPVICGGGLFTADPEYVFRAIRPDFAVLGEGEQALVELLSAVASGVTQPNIPGVAYAQGSEFLSCKASDAVLSADALPVPDYDVVDIERYFSLLNHRDHHLNCRGVRAPRLLPIMGSRSCPYKCTFCFHTLGPKYRSRSIDRVFDEIQHFHELYSINVVYLCDELFSNDIPRVHRFCDLIRGSGMKLSWSCMLRVTDAEADLLKAMKSAGCTHVSWGFESASPVVLQSMQKKISPEGIRNAIQFSDAANIGVQAGFIYGDPAETVESIEETRLFNETYCNDLCVNSFYITPYPGSEVFNHCLRSGIIGDKDAYYDNIHLAPVYNMTSIPSAEFFKRVDPLVTKRFTGIRVAQRFDFENTAQSDDFGRTVFDLAATCPHCACDMSFEYPISCNGSSECVLSLFTHLELLCVDCGKRFLVPTAGLTGLKAAYEAYIAAVQDVGESCIPVIILPTIGKLAMQDHAAYGFEPHKLNVVAFMDPGGPLGMAFQGYPSLELTAENVRKYWMCEFIVAPCANPLAYVSFLLDCGIAQGRIHFLDLGPCLGAEVSERCTYDAQPKLIEQGYKGYNLVSYGGRLWGCKQSLGSMDLTQLDEDQVTRLNMSGELYVCDSLLELRQRIDSDTGVITALRLLSKLVC